MKQIEKDFEASVVRLDATQKRNATGELSRVDLSGDSQIILRRVKELEKMVLCGETRTEVLAEKFQSLEMAVQALSVRYSHRQQENEAAILEVARSLREHFEEFHRLKSDLLGLSAHVDRWTKRVERMCKLAPIRWAQRLRKKT